MQPTVLYEDNHLLVIDKPSGMTTQGAAAGQSSAVEWAKAYLKRKYAKPGNVFVGVVSRLDRDVSGVLVLARTSKGAARLSEQFRSRQVEKVYWAVVEGSPPPTLDCVDWLAEDRKHKRMAVVPADEDQELDDVQEARLSLRRLRLVHAGALLEIVLETGRKHQIRVQLAGRGWPIVGDRKYGSRRSFTGGIALCARRLSLDHPTRDERITVESPPPATWRELGVDR